MEKGWHCIVNQENVGGASVGAHGIEATGNLADVRVMSSRSTGQ